MGITTLPPFLCYWVSSALNVQLSGSLHPDIRTDVEEKVLEKTPTSIPFKPSYGWNASSGLSPLAVGPFFCLPCVRRAGALTSVGGRVVCTAVGSKGGIVNCPVAEHVRRDMLGTEAEN